MKIRQNGSFVELEYEEDWSEAMQLRCTCGKRLHDHEHGYAYGSRKVLEIRGCEKSGCSQFRLKNKKSTFAFI